MKFNITKMSGVNSESEQEYLIDECIDRVNMYVYLTMIYYMVYDGLNADCETNHSHS